MALRMIAQVILDATGTINMHSVRNRIRFLLATVVCSWVVACSAGVDKPSRSAVSVCEVVSNPNRYNNKYVTVNADIISSFHGILAFDNACHGVIRLWVPDNKADTEYGKILLRSETDPGNGFYHAYIGGTFTAVRENRNLKTNVHGTIVVNHLSGWLPGRRHKK